MHKKVLWVLIFSLILITPSFADAPSAWANDSVNRLKTSDVFDSEFYDGFKTNMTREEFAYLSVKLYEELSGKTTTIGDDPFKDTDDEWVLKGYKEGLISGYSSDTYGPNDLITREQLAVLLMRVIIASDVEYDSDISGLEFTDDNEISSWAKESVYLANKNGILNGMGDGSMSPKSNATKEQAMIMSLRITDNSVTTTNIDNSVNNNLNISDINNSNITINIDNTDNSITDSYNTHYDYSTVVNNYIDNSVTINNSSADSIKEIIEALMDIKAGVENFRFTVFSEETEGPIVGAVLYLDNEVKGVSDENGVIMVDVAQVFGEQNLVIRKTGYKQYYDSLELVNDENLEVYMESAVEKVNSIYTSTDKELYEAFIESERDYFEINLYGQFFDYRSDTQYLDFQIIEKSTGENLVNHWNKNSYGTAWNGMPFSSFEVKLSNNGLEVDKEYSVVVVTSEGEANTNLVVTDKPIIRRVDTREISIIGDYAFITYRLNNDRDSISDIPLVLTNENGDVIYQEVTKFKVEYENLVYFELINREVLEDSRYLYVRSSLENSFIFAMQEFHKMETVYKPIILVQDYQATERTNNNYVDETVIAFYGYNLVGETFKGNLEIDGTTLVVAESHGEAKYASNGFIEYLEFKFNRDELETGEYTIDIEGIGGYGRYNITK